METVLLHSCCAPCSAAVLEWMLAHDIRPVVFYFNPNIFPQAEYEKRKAELTRHCEKLGVEVIDGDWDHETWLENVKGLENEPERGRRCEVCFTVRLRAAAKIAHERGIARFADRVVPMDECAAMVALDISGRPFLTFEKKLSGKIGEYLREGLPFLDLARRLVTISTEAPIAFDPAALAKKEPDQAGLAQFYARWEMSAGGRRSARPKKVAVPTAAIGDLFAAPEIPALLQSILTFKS